jgi:hypothetical protein
MLKVLLFLFLPALVCAQYSVGFTSSTYAADLNVKAGQNIIYADLDVEISENVIYEDFTIGFTNSKHKADVVIGNSSSASDIQICISNSLYADIDINVSESQVYEDITIEIKTSGNVDYLVYNEDEFLSKEKLVVALLPIINSYLEYKFSKIPYWSPKKGLGNASDVLEPTLYCCPSLNHWIDEINDGVLTLEDDSMWIIYEDDQYTTMLWLPVDKIYIEPSSTYGHYYLSRINSLTKKKETVRAICVKV